MSAVDARKRQRIIDELRANADPKLRALAERLAKIPNWKAEELRDVLRDMQAEVSS